MLEISNYMLFLPEMVWVVGLFLMWYGFILCWIFPMYYRSLRSRVLIEQSLWIEVLSSVYLLNALRGLFEKIKRNKKSDKRIEGKEVKVEYFMKSWRNKIVNQKKFYGVYSGEMDEVLDVKNEVWVEYLGWKNYYYR